MKNKKFILLVVFVFFLSLCFNNIFSETNSINGKDEVLDKLKDPKQYIEKESGDNKQGKQENNMQEGKTSTTDSAESSWFSQHQKVWGTEQTSIEGGTEGEGAGKEGTGDAGVSWIYYISRMIVSLIFVIGLILVLLGSLRYFSQRTSKGVKSIGKIVGVLYLSPRARIYYVHSAGKVFVLGISGDQMRLLYAFPEDEFFASVAEEEITGSALPQKSFNKVLDEVETRIQAKSSVEKDETVENIDDELASLKANIQRLQ